MILPWYSWSSCTASKTCFINLIIVAWTLNGMTLVLPFNAGTKNGHWVWQDSLLLVSFIIKLTMDLAALEMARRRGIPKPLHQYNSPIPNIGEITTSNTSGQHPDLSITLKWRHVTFDQHTAPVSLQASHNPSLFWPLKKQITANKHELKPTLNFIWPLGQRHPFVFM